ncbi:MAG: putative viral replication protein [Cressdnaviricota sp.]|nr:MAG: putative viral replication protein [Cressdnaviricota sp.]
MAYCCVWDFTAPSENNDSNEIKNMLRENCKKWCFQLERGETGYEHYQGRVSLKTKTRLTGLKKLFPNNFHWSPTSNENRDNTFYVSKEETRLDGPWSNKDVEIYIPRQIREIEKLYPWQQFVVDTYDVWNTRQINCIVDVKGCNGKSTLTQYMRAHKLAFKIPFCNDFKDIMRIVYDVPTYRCYIIDIPRAIQKDRLFQMYSAIEEVKGGYAYDDRYSFRDKVFDCPNIWVFMNVYPSVELFSRDRWILWDIDENNDLIRLN